MSLRLILGVAGVALVFSACGCGVGPIKDRLYVSEWRSNRDHPIQVEKGWQYEGEHWEHFVFVEHKKTAKEREAEE